jgi:penicillin-binding protein 1B
VLLAAFVLYVIYLDIYITSRFEGRRWDLPAQVYARPLELYEGLTLDPLRLERELRRLGYQFALNPKEPGTYYVRKNQVRLVSRPFRFWDGAQSSRKLVIDFNDGRVNSLSDGRKAIPIIRFGADAGR